MKLVPKEKKSIMYISFFVSFQLFFYSINSIYIIFLKSYYVFFFYIKRFSNCLIFNHYIVYFTSEYIFHQL